MVQSYEFHAPCSRKFFGAKIPPVISYFLNEMTDLARNVVQSSITIPGVQPRLSMSLIEEAGQNYDKRLIVVGALGGNYFFNPPSPDFK